MHKRRRIYEAKEKIIFEGAEAGTYIQFFKDEFLENKSEGANSAPLSGAGAINGKAVLHNRISEYIFTRLQEVGIPTYFIKSLNMREQLVHTVEMIPLTLICHNNISPLLAERLGLDAGEALIRPLFEFYYANEKLNNPLVSEDHILAFEWASEGDLEDMIILATRINDFLCGLFAAVGLRLANIQLKFGRLWSNDAMQLVLATEISPDTCSLWTRENLAEKQPAADKKIDKLLSEQQSDGNLAKIKGDAAKFQSADCQYVARKLGLLNEYQPSYGREIKIIHP